MVRKLIAYDARLTARPLLVAYGSVMLVNIVAGVMIALRVPGLSQVFDIVSTLLPILFFVGAQIFILVNYYRTMYGRLGYFTMTVPVAAKTLYWAKSIYAAIVFLVSLLATIIAYLPSKWMGAFIAQGKPLSDGLKMLGELVDSVSVGVIILMAGMVLLSMASFFSQYQFVISVGLEARLNHLGAGGPVVVYLIVYFAMQILLIGGFMLFPVVVDFTGGEVSVKAMSVVALMGEAIRSNDNLQVLPMGWFPVLLVLVGYFCWRTIRSIRLHTSLR